MKKIKILVASVLCCAMGYTGYTAYEKMTMSEAEKFMIANVEALTSGESNDNNPWLRTCYAYGYIGFNDEYVCEGQSPYDTPKACVLLGFYQGHENC